MLALVLRLLLANYSFWFDEWASLLFSDQPLDRLWSSWMVRETNPPLFYTLLKFWSVLGAHDVVVLRLLPILAGVANIAVLAGICARWHSRRAALALVLLLALSPGNIILSQMLRAYVFAMLGASVSLGGLMLWWDGGRTRVPGMALYVAGALLAFYSHTTMLLWQVAAPVVALTLRASDVRAGRWRIVQDLTIMALAALAGSSWWLWLSLAQLSEHSGNIAHIGRVSLGATIGQLSHYGFLLRFATSLHGLTYSASFSTISARDWIDLVEMVVVGGLFVGSVVLTWRNRLVRFCIIALPFFVLLFWVAGFIHPVVTERTVQWLMIFPAVVIACGVAELPGRLPYAVALAVAAVVLVSNGLTHRDERVTQDWRGALAQVAATPGGGLVVEHNAMLVLAHRACAFQFDQPGCPFPVVALDSRVQLDSWSVGMGLDQPAGEPAVRQRLAAITAVYSMRHVLYDPLYRLRRGRVEPRLTWNDHFLEGPFPGRSFAVAWTQ